MEAPFWQQCWEKDHIGFHQDDFNPLLVELWQQWAPLTKGEPSAVFVPLSGKSNDMLFIAGHNKVLGAELSEIACRDFYAENNIEVEVSDEPRYVHYHSDRIDLYQGDFFALTAQDVESCRLIYDRAALVALPESLRTQYVAHLRAIFPAKTKLMLLSLEYPEGEIEGPPFRVTEQEVNALFAGCRIEKVIAQPLSDSRFARRKLSVSCLVEVVYFIEFCPRSLKGIVKAPKTVSIEEMNEAIITKGAEF